MNPAQASWRRISPVSASPNLRLCSGEIDYAERDTECYGANITRETTSIYPTLDEDCTEEETIRTEDFRAALTARIEEKERFDKWKRKKEKWEQQKKR